MESCNDTLQLGHARHTSSLHVANNSFLVQLETVNLLLNHLDFTLLYSNHHSFNLGCLPFKVVHQFLCNDAQFFHRFLLCRTKLLTQHGFHLCTQTLTFLFNLRLCHCHMLTKCTYDFCEKFLSLSLCCIGLLEHLSYYGGSLLNRLGCLFNTQQKQSCESSELCANFVQFVAQCQCRDMRTHSHHTAYAHFSWHHPYSI